MSNIYKWGRNESTMWPPHGPVYTWGAVFGSVILCGLLMWLCFYFRLTPLQRYYLPYYIRTEMAGAIRPTGKYQLVYVLDARGKLRPALDDDVEPGKTVLPGGKSIPLELSPQALSHGVRALYREPARMYRNQALRAYLARWVYGGHSPILLFSRPIEATLGLLAIGLCFTAGWDVARRRRLRYGRRLRGPEMMEPKAFTERFQSHGLGLVVNKKGTVARLPALAENKHLAMIGDTGSGKSTADREAPGETLKRFASEPERELWRRVARLRGARSRRPARARAGLCKPPLRGRFLLGIFAEVWEPQRELSVVQFSLLG